MYSSKSKSTFRRWDPGQRLELLHKYKLKAGMVTQRQFCQENDLGLSTLTLWLRRSRAKSPKVSQSGFIPVEILSPLVGGTLELVLPEVGSLKFHGNFDPMQVASLVKALRR